MEWFFFHLIIIYLEEVFEDMWLLNNKIYF